MGTKTSGVIPFNSEQASKIGLRPKPQGAGCLDYDQIPSNSVVSVSDIAERIRQRFSKTYIENGVDLLLAKKILGHGNFTPWLKAEFGMSRSTAANYMKVAVFARDKPPVIGSLPLTVLLLLADAGETEQVNSIIASIVDGRKYAPSELKKILSSPNGDGDPARSVAKAVENRSAETDSDIFLTVPVREAEHGNSGTECQMGELRQITHSELPSLAKRVACAVDSVDMGHLKSSVSGGIYDQFCLLFRKEITAGSK